jgi:hypothetical protein
MTKFVKERFNFHGGYLSYDRKFVARFKYNRNGWGAFRTFLIKNFTVEEYFEKLKDSTPVQVMKSKGFVTYVERSACRKYSLKPNRANAKIAMEKELAQFDNYLAKKASH